MCIVPRGIDAPGFLNFVIVAFGSSTATVNLGSHAQWDAACDSLVKTRLLTNYRLLKVFVSVITENHIYSNYLLQILK